LGHKDVFDSIRTVRTNQVLCMNQEGRAGTKWPAKPNTLFSGPAAEEPAPFVPCES